MNKTYKELKELPPQQWLIYNPTCRGFLGTVGGIGDIFDAKRLSKRDAMLLQAPPDFTAVSITNAIRRHYELRASRESMFDGQPRHVAYFAELHADGRGTSEPVVRTRGGKRVRVTITVNDEDLSWFPELAGRDRVVLDYYGDEPDWTRIEEVRDV